MKISNLLCISVMASGPMFGQADFFGSWGRKKEESEPMGKKSSGNIADTPKNSQTIQSIISEQRRYVLYNSRRLAGQCLDICATKTSPPLGGTTADPTSGPTSTPTKTPTSVGLDCESLQNLGYGFSEATGNPHYDGSCFPPVTGLDATNIPGRDDSVAVFAGGDYIGRRAAEVEGKVVVLGNIVVESGGPSNFVSVGVGSHIIPNSGGDCVVVGGDLKAYRDIQVFKQNPDMMCDIVYKGSGTNTERWKTNGEVRNDPHYDMTHYEQMRAVLLKKSKFWKTLPPNGKVYDSYSTTMYECTDDDEIQVFSIDAEKLQDLRLLTELTGMKFTDNCEGKTILINVQGFGDIVVKAAAMIFKDRQGYQEGGFPPCMTQSMLWNFPDFRSVEIGGHAGSSEFHGSLLVAGNLKLATSGHSGRTMVLGNIVHDSNHGSEFHSYPYDPPIPLPDPDDLCELPDGWETYIPVYPTISPTTSPTADPSKCKAIPKARLPGNAYSVTDDNCATCEPPNASKYWPCDLDPPRCEGNCELR